MAGANPRGSIVTLPLIVALIAVSPIPALAQGVCAPSQDRLIIDHGQRSARLLIDGVARDVEDGDDPRVPARKFVVEVIHTNTALFTFTVAAEKFEAEELTAIRGFVGALGPYFIDAAGRVVAGRTAMDPGAAPDPVQQAAADVTAAIKEVLVELTSLDAALFNEGGLRDLDVKILKALRALSAAGDESPTLLDCSTMPARVAALRELPWPVS